jgi:aryl-alcohol dehydrogenase-like predicted oxidoreductase
MLCLVPVVPLRRQSWTGEVKRAEEYPQGDYRRNDPRYQGANYDANVAAAQTVREIAAAKHAKPGQIALAWLLHKGNTSFAPQDCRACQTLFA